MADVNSDRGNPDPKLATTPVTAPAAETSSLQKPDLATRIAQAKTPAEIRALKSEMIPTMQQTLKTKHKDFTGKEETPADTKPPAGTETPAEETPAGETPAGEEGEQAPAEGTPAEGGEADDDENDDGGEGPIEPITGKRAHIRLGQEDKVGRLAASLMKRNRDMPMDEAVERAKKQLGIKPQGEQAKTPEETNSNPGMPETVEATVTSIAELRAERNKASTALEFEKVADITSKIEDLIQHRNELARQGERKQQDEATAYDRQFSSSENRATELYAFAGDPKSEGGKRMLEIDAQLKADEDPLYNSPNKPLKIAQMVAAELNIAPKKKGIVTAAPAKAAATATTTLPPKKQVLPGGNSRTTPPPINQPNPVDAKIKAAPNTVAGIRQLRKELGLPN